MTQELDLDKLLGRILKISIEMLAGQAGLIALRNDSGDWRVSTSNGLDPTFLRYLQPWLNQAPEDGSPENEEIAWINRLLRELTFSASLGLLTGVGLPLVAANQVIGVIFIFRSYPDVFSPNDHALLSSFATQAAIAVRNAQLYTQVTHEKQRMGALLDSAADGILVLASNRKIERANPAFSRLYGRSIDQIQGLMHDEIIQFEGPPQGMTLEQAEAGGWPLTPHAYLYVEGDLVRPGQPHLPVGITYAPLVSEEGILLNTIATLRDITRWRQAEEIKSTFISIISHELKTPVALIKGYAGTLRREDATWDRNIIKDSLQVIEEEADRLTELIENMLDASRLQAGGFALKRSDVNFHDLANRLISRMQTQTQKHHLTSTIPIDFPIILADETRLGQVISNLISNAIKYSPGGEIILSGQVRPEQVILCLSDQGPGIAAEDIPHIFDRFYRGPQASRNTKGAGLGLYLTKAVIEAHGGRIWVNPLPTHGTQICFSLPRY